MQIKEIREKVAKAFAGLVFNEEEHSYFVELKQYISVSTQLKRFYTPFPAEVIAPFSAQKWNRNNPFEQKTTEDILAEWKKTADVACERGSKIHLFGEEYPNFSEPTCIEEEAIIKYYKDLDPKYEVLFLELQMYSPDLDYSGTGDIILYNKETGKVRIDDYKTNGDLFKNFNDKRMLDPFSDLLDSPMSHYKLQLNHYKMLLENMTDLEVEEMNVIWLKEDNNDIYQIYNIPDLTEKLLPYYE
jgi:hypothetical protein